MALLRADLLTLIEAVPRRTEAIVDATRHVTAEFARMFPRCLVFEGRDET
jgi:hypothetical protein